MKFAIFILFLGLAFSLKLKSKQDNVLSYERCMHLTNSNSTACDEIIDCETNGSDCDVVTWSKMEENTAVCYSVEHPDWSGATTDMTESADVVACMWKAFCE